MNKLMREVLYGMAFLQENQMVHADIRPSLISVPLVPTQNFRLLDRLGNPSPPDQVQKLNIQREESIYTSPAIFKSILRKKKQVRHNPFKSDMFSLGMILLEAGILEPVQEVYDYRKGAIDEIKLVELVEKFIDRYPTDFVLQEALMIMLEFSEKLRQTPLKMLNTLRELKEIEIEEGRAEISYINYGNDPMMNKLHFTESGYVFKEADYMLISNFSKVHQNRSKLSLMRSEEIIPEEMEKSLVSLVKNKKATPNSSTRQMTVDPEEKQVARVPEPSKEEQEMLDSFMRNEARTNELRKKQATRVEQNRQDEASSVEEIRTKIPIRMESLEDLDKAEPKEKEEKEERKEGKTREEEPMEKNPNLEHKIVAQEEMFQSFKKISCEKPQKETPEKIEAKSKVLGTDKVTVSTAGDPNVFNINDYLDYYGIKTGNASQGEREKEERVDLVPKLEEAQERVEPEKEVDRIQVERVSTHSKGNSNEEISEASEKKESVYDYFSAEKFEGLASSGDFDSKEEPLEIIPEDPKKWAELKNSTVDEVNFEDAPSVSLYKGPVTNLFDPFGSRLKVKYDARKELRKKRKQQKKKATQVEKQNQQELMKDIRETNVIKRTIVNQHDRIDSGAQDQGNIFLEAAPKNEDFGGSREDFDKELLSQAPGEALKLKSGYRQESPPNNKLNSNFTLNQENQKKPEPVPPKKTQFKSEVVLDPTTNEVRLKTHSKDEISKKLENVELGQTGKVHLKMQKRVIPTHTKVESKTPITEFKSQTNKPTKQTTKYLKLVVDEHGRKKYKMVSVENSPVNSTAEIQTQQHPLLVNYSPPVVHEFPYKSAKVAHLPRTEGTFKTNAPVPSQTQRREFKPVSPVTQPKVQYREVPTQQKNYTVYQRAQGTEPKYYVQHNSKNQAEVKSSGQKYTTYTYSGGTRRFENHMWTGSGNPIGEARRVSPMVLQKPPRRSSKKVIIYRNGVKVSEKVYTEE